MKLVHMASGLAVAIALAACADKSADIQTPAPAANTSISATQQSACLLYTSDAADDVSWV